MFARPPFSPTTLRILSTRNITNPRDEHNGSSSSHRTTEARHLKSLKRPMVLLITGLHALTSTLGGPFMLAMMLAVDDMLTRKRRTRRTRRTRTSTKTRTTKRMTMTMTMNTQHDKYRLNDMMSYTTDLSLGKVSHIVRSHRSLVGTVLRSATCRNCSTLESAIAAKIVRHSKC